MTCTPANLNKTKIDKKQLFLRWDHADTNMYYYLTGVQLQLLLSRIESGDLSLNSSDYNDIDCVKSVVNMI